jgi:hypothetical protein
VSKYLKAKGKESEPKERNQSRIILMRLKFWEGIIMQSECCPLAVTMSFEHTFIPNFHFREQRLKRHSHSELKESESHHFDVAPVPGRNNDAARMLSCVCENVF